MKRAKPRKATWPPVQHNYPSVHLCVRHDWDGSKGPCPTCKKESN